MRPYPLKSLLALLLSPLLANASGQLDPRFDGDGIRVVQASAGGDLLTAGLIDAAGRFVGAGRAVEQGFFGSVIRVSPGGVLDASFGNGGIVRIPPLAGYNTMTWVDVAEQADGKLMLAGYAGENGLGPGNNSRAYVCRLLSNGSLDPSFGSAGCTQPQFWFESNNDKVVAMALQADGRIVLVGWTDFNGIGGLEYVVARLDSDGSYDGCFGDVTCQTGGLLIEPEPDADITEFEARAVALAPDGRILIAGRATSPDAEMAVIRLLPTGVVDVGFGNGGHRLVAVDLGGSFYDQANAVSVNSMGSVFLAGEADNGFGGKLAAVAALGANGNPIGGFGSGGITTLFFNDVSAEHIPTRVLVQDDGKLLVAGYTKEVGGGAPPFDDCGIARLRPNGQLDPVFGVDGKLNIDGGLGLEPAQPDACLGLAADGRSIVLFGRRRPNGFDIDDSLLIKLDQDDVFRDGYEIPSP